MCVGKYETCLCCRIQKTTWRRCAQSWIAVARIRDAGGEEADFPHPSACIGAYHEFGIIPVGLCPYYNSETRPCPSWSLAIMNRYVSADAAKARAFRQHRIETLKVSRLQRFERSGVFLKRPLQETAKPTVSNLTNHLILEAWGKQVQYQIQQTKTQEYRHKRLKLQREKRKEMKVIRIHIMRDLDRSDNFKSVSPSLSKSYQISKESRRRGNRIFNSLVTSTGLGGG